MLRLHRRGYHSRRAIESELAWTDALNAAGCVTAPRAIAGRDGRAVQQAGPLRPPGPGPAGPADGPFMVMFEFMEGAHPDESGDLTGPFEKLGETAAKTHNHSAAWARPEPFERLTWDTAAVFGPAPVWGDWRAAPNLEPAARTVLEKAEQTVTRRLAAFGRAERRFGLIHADMRLANLLIHNGAPRLIDFDDCGFGWFLYDFAAAVSFIEDGPQVPALRGAWVRGYRKIRPLADGEEREIDTFVMLRRMALLAWVGSHMEAPEPQALAPRFARVSAELAESYLSLMG